MKAKKTVYGIVYQDVLRSDKLTFKGKLIYSMLTTYADKERKCWRSLTTLTEDLGITRHSVIDGIKELRVLGMTITKGKNNRNEYDLGALERACRINSSSAGDAPLNNQVVQEMHHSSAGDAPLSSAGDALRTLPINITNNTNSDFENFWDQYHSITSMPKTDRKDAKNHWKKLNQEDRKKAAENIQPYFNSLPKIDHCKKARTYLSGENFNDGFKKPTKTIPQPKNL
jgi:biotin operon repressor